MAEPKPKKPTKPKAFALDIFAVLSQLERGNLHLFETLSDEERKGLSSYVVLNWMFGTTNQTQVILLNELVNPLVFSFGVKHPELLVKLLACCGTKTNKRFSWIPLPKRQKEAKLSVKVLMETFGYSAREAQGNIGLLSKETMIEYSNDLGWSKEEIVKLKTELKQRGQKWSSIQIP